MFCLNAVLANNICRLAHWNFVWYRDVGPHCTVENYITCMSHSFVLVSDYHFNTCAWIPALYVIQFVFYNNIIAMWQYNWTTVLVPCILILYIIFKSLWNIVLLSWNWFFNSPDLLTIIDWLITACTTYIPNIADLCLIVLNSELSMFLKCLILEFDWIRFTGISQTFNSDWVLWNNQVSTL
jgi:hypothetical protein